MPVDVLAERMRQAMLDRDRQAGVPARRRRRAAAGADGRVRPAEGGRRREGRHRRAGAARRPITMDAVSEVLIARAARSRRPQLDARRVGDGARRAGRRCSCSCRRRGLAPRTSSPETIMQISLGGPIGPNDGGLATLGRPHDSAGTAGNEEGDRAGASAGGEGAGDDRADQGAAEEDHAEQGRGEGSRRATPDQGRGDPEGLEHRGEPARRARDSACRRAAAATGGYLEVSNFCCPEYLATMRT